MEPQLFRRFAALAYEKAGISIKPGKEALVAARVAKRQRALSISDAQGYLEFLERDPSGEELSRFLDVISTHFTSFFRERDHFDLLAEELSRVAAAGQRRVRIWSAACSTGEEPYTMAMTALGLPCAEGLDLKILATDISVDTLRQAQAGLYTAERLAPVPAGLRSRWFTRRHDPLEEGAEQYEASPALKALVTYRRLNLAEPPFPMTGPFDVVFCRNVLIYFDQPTRQRLLGAIAELIRPGGLLCIGHTETLSGITCDLKMTRPSVFRRPSSAPVT